MHLVSPVVYNGDTESIPRFEALPDSPADEMQRLDDQRAAMEATAAAEFGPLPADEQARVIARFPWGYPHPVPYGPQVQFMAGTVRPFIGEIYIGTARIVCGRYASHLEAMNAVVIRARKLAASRLRELRQTGKCPKLPVFAIASRGDSFLNRRDLQCLWPRETNRSCPISFTTIAAFTGGFFVGLCGIFLQLITSQAHVLRIFNPESHLWEKEVARRGDEAKSPAVHNHRRSESTG